MQMTYYEELLANTNLSQQEVQEYLLNMAFGYCHAWNVRFQQALILCKHEAEHR